MVLIVRQRQSSRGVSFQCSPAALILAAYLCGMVDLERSLALCVKIPVALHLVKFTDNYLPAARMSASLQQEARSTNLLA